MQGTPLRLLGLEKEKRETGKKPEREGTRCCCIVHGCDSMARDNAVSKQLKRTAKINKDKKDKKERMEEKKNM